MTLTRLSLRRLQWAIICTLAFPAMVIGLDLVLKGLGCARIWYVLILALAGLMIFAFRAGELKHFVDHFDDDLLLVTRRWLLLVTLFIAGGQLLICLAILQGLTAQTDDLITYGALLQTMGLVWADSGKLIRNAYRKQRRCW